MRPDCSSKWPFWRARNLRHFFTQLFRTNSSKSSGVHPVRYHDTMPPRGAFMTICRTRFTLARHGAIVLRTTHVDWFLGPPFENPKSVALTWNRCLCGVMGHTPLSHLSQSVGTVMSHGFRCTWVRSDSCIPEWPKFGLTVPFQTPVVMTQGGGCVPWTVGRITSDHSTDHDYVLSRVVSRLNPEFGIPLFLGFNSGFNNKSIICIRIKKGESRGIEMSHWNSDEYGWGAAPWGAAST